jgi:hypothetical protein
VTLVATLHQRACTQALSSKVPPPPGGGLLNACMYVADDDLLLAVTAECMCPCLLRAVSIDFLRVPSLSPCY